MDVHVHFKIDIPTLARSGRHARGDVDELGDGENLTLEPRQLPPCALRAKPHGPYVLAAFQSPALHSRRGRDTLFEDSISLRTHDIGVFSWRRGSRMQKRYTVNNKDLEFLHTFTLCRVREMRNIHRPMAGLFSARPQPAGPSPVQFWKGDQEPHTNDSSSTTGCSQRELKVPNPKTSQSTSRSPQPRPPLAAL
jgi:hypothetical protein